MGLRSATRSVWRFGAEVVAEIRRDQLFDVAAGVTFWLLLSLPAALLAAVTSASFLGDDTARTVQDAIIELVETTFATQAPSIRENVEELFVRQRTGVLSVSLAIAIFTVSRGFAGLLRALDTAYSVENRRSFLNTRIVALGLAIGTVAAMAGSSAGALALRRVGMPTWVVAVSAFSVLIVWAATVFHLGPHHHTPWKYDLPGAAFTAIGWLLMSAGFGLYVQLAGSGNQIVGTIGGLLLGLTWLWLLCVVVLIGAEINGVIARRRDVVRKPGVITGHIVRAGRSRIRPRRHNRPDPDLDTDDPEVAGSPT